MKKKGKAENKRQKAEIQMTKVEEQKGESTSQTALIQQNVKIKEEKQGKKDKPLQKEKSNSSGDRFKK